MKIIIIVAIIIVSTLSAVFIFSAIPSDIWKDQRTDFTGVSPPGELDEKIDCLSKGGVWDYTSCNFEEPEPEHISEDELNLSDAMQKLQEIYSLNSSFGPFNIRDAIVGFGIAGDVLVVDVLTEYYESDHLELIKQNIRDIVGDKVTIEFSPSGAIIPTNTEPEPVIYDVDSFKVSVIVSNAIIHEIFHKVEFDSIFVNLESLDDGFITLDIPRKLIDASRVDGSDSSFFVIINHEEVHPEEISSNSETRKITIPFEKGTTQIEIIGADEI